MFSCPFITPRLAANNHETLLVFYQLKLKTSSQKKNGAKNIEKPFQPIVSIGVLLFNFPCNLRWASGSYILSYKFPEPGVNFFGAENS